MRIEDLVYKETLSAEDIFSVVEEVGARGDVIIIKNDGIRSDDAYSVIIIPSKPSSEGLRCDNSSLSTAMKTVLKKYIEI